MAVRLFLDPYGQPAQSRLAAVIAEAKSQDPLAPVTVVVPTQYAGLSLRRALASEKGLVNVRFLVMARFAEYLGAPAMAAQGKAPLSPLTELALIAEVASRPGNAGPLRGIAANPNLHLALQSSFRSLARLRPEAIDAIRRHDPVRAQIVDWHHEVRRRLERYYDREELARAAAQAVTAGASSASLRDMGAVILYLTQALSPGETELTKRLGDRGLAAVVLGLTGDGKVDAAALRLARDLGLAPAGAAARQDFPASHLVVASDLREEVRWIVRHVTSQAEKGVPFHRIAVLYRQREPYATLIESQLRLAELPVAGPDVTPLRETSAGRLLTGGLDALTNDLRRDSVMRWLSEAPVRLGGMGDGPASAEMARWDLVSRAAGIVKGIEQWRSRVGAFRQGQHRRAAELELLEETSPAQLLGMRESVAAAERLLQFIESLAAAKPPDTGASWKSLATWTKDFLQRFADGPAGWPDRDRSAFDQVMAVLDELGALDGAGAQADLGAFKKLLEQALEAPAGRLGATGTGVFVGPVATAQGMDFDLVYLAGMAEGAFPPSVPDDALLPDGVVAPLGLGGALPPREARRAEERRLYLAALAAGHERILTFARSAGPSRRVQHASPWFMEAARGLAGRYIAAPQIEQLSSAPWLTVIQSPEDGLRFATGLAPADLHDLRVAGVAAWRRSGLPLAAHPLAAENSPLGRALQMDQARRSDSLTAWDGGLRQLSGSSRRLARPFERTVSPTALERWAVCPYRFFLGDVLRLSALEEPEELQTISAVDRGSLVHRTLERFIGEAKQSGTLPGFGEPWRDSHRRRLLAIAEVAFREDEARGITGRPLLWEAVKSEVRQDLEAFIEQDSRWRAQRGLRPWEVEVTFGHAGRPPVELALADGETVRFRCAIDRVDVTADASEAVVIDYKTGGAAPYGDMKDDPLGAGRHLQLPVYGLAVRSLLGESAAVEAAYWFITARGNFEWRPVALTDVEDRFKQVVAGIARGISSGLFPANPGGAGLDSPSNCRACDFDRVCPANRAALWKRKSRDAIVAPYLELAQAPPPTPPARKAKP